MLQDAIELQQKQVRRLVHSINTDKKVYVFKAPTGSGKTHMIADFMNTIIGQDSEAVFVVSERSKSGLSNQIYDDFAQYQQTVFQNLNTYHIHTNNDKKKKNDALLFIPPSYNVYVLPSDLVKKGGQLEKGALLLFFETMTQTEHKHLYLVRDEGHIETKNLIADYGKYFLKQYDVSATPDLKKGQTPDIEMTEREAVEAKIIKRVITDAEGTLEEALDKFLSIRPRYIAELNMNPCLIIQISNTSQGKEELLKIKAVLNKDKYDELKWVAMGTDIDGEGNDKIKDLPDVRRNAVLKLPNTHIDVLVFKMKITEGWDIPRACMLYQMRNSQSDVLDEQVVGRVRRNPRIRDFEDLPESAQKLATTAWVYGVRDDSTSQAHAIVRSTPEAANMKIKTTALRRPEAMAAIDVAGLVQEKKLSGEKDIFSLYRQTQSAKYAMVKKACQTYLESGDGKAAYNNWFRVMENLPTVYKETQRVEADYAASMYVDNEVAPQEHTITTESEFEADIENWLWRREDEDTAFYFDSKAEKKWFSILKGLNRQQVIYSLETGEGDKIYLFGKNYTVESEIRYEYYEDGVIRSSYPDFLLEDVKGNIHIFESKSLDEKAGSIIDRDEYEAKIENLKMCYKAASRNAMTGHYFYIPILEDNVWTIYSYIDGRERVIDGQEDFVRYMKDLVTDS